MATTSKKKGEEPVDHIHEAALENAKRRNEAKENGGPPEAKKPETEPLLKLSTVLEPRPTIEIDGANYELRHKREFSIVDQHTLQIEGDEFDELWEKKENLNSKQRQRIKVVLDSMFDKVLIAPKDVKAKLDDESRRAVVLTFTRAPWVMAGLEDMIEQITQSRQQIRETETSDT